MNKKKPFLALFIGAFILSVNCQISKTNLIKKYHQKDTVSSIKDAYFLICANNIFINYGIYINKSESEWYIWYATGNYSIHEGTITCQSFSVIPNQAQLIKDIKASYRRRQDHLLIESDYEFVKERYVNTLFLEKNNMLVDDKKQLIYSLEDQ